MIAPEVAVKTAVVCPAATVTDAGVVSRELVLDNPTDAPPVGAAMVRVTVQALFAATPRVVGVQTSDETPKATRFTVAFSVPPFNVAVTVAV